MNTPNAAQPGAAEPGSRPGARSGRSLFILAIGTFTLGVNGFVLSGLLPQVATSLHVLASTAGQLTTLFALVYAVGSTRSSPRRPAPGTGGACCRRAWASSWPE